MREHGETRYAHTREGLWPELIWEVSESQWFASIHILYWLNNFSDQSLPVSNMAEVRKARLNDSLFPKVLGKLRRVKNFKAGPTHL